MKLLDINNMPPKGTKVLCVKSDVSWYEEGEEYIIDYDTDGDFGVIDNGGDAVQDLMSLCTFEIVDNTFTKDDFKDGDICTHKDGVITVFYQNGLVVLGNHTELVRGTIRLGSTSNLDEELRHTHLTEFTINKVERSGEVLFERKPKRKVTLELTDEQIAWIKDTYSDINIEIKEQGIQILVTEKIYDSTVDELISIRGAFMELLQGNIVNKKFGICYNSSILAGEEGYEDICYDLVCHYGSTWEHSPYKDIYDAYPVPHVKGYGLWEGKNLEYRQDLLSHIIEGLTELIDGNIPVDMSVHEE